MRTLDHPATDELELDTVLAALGDPVRRRIVLQLADGHDEQACIAFELPVSKSTSTHHFRVLRTAGVISQCYRGTAIHSTLRRDDLDERFPGLLDAVLDAARR
ncbi:ArsR/SmtB family transcription factor [Mycetocola reblochoni]|uniref:Transcriptional regulator, ArsR family n=2 Tax=Mycetocola reblochoni TaxID=331618 RepID=A0A1R4JUK0_9MICO|nr:helix-turn-helix transcriptional regulator [Mycetocola reblochoni]RLP71120.1 transcriptional regulator [Mycetocola reblochoni]SJN35760.1 Transcriptional regulator, ArsR family [Mycetocola reblochoni REB411]